MLSDADDLPEQLFLDPIWQALTTTHRHLTLATADAVRYQPAVSPFAALRNLSDKAFGELRDLVTVGESVIVCRANLTGLRGLRVLGEHQYHQMVLPGSVKPPAPNISVVPLTCDDASEMFALSQIAFPEFLRPRSCELGQFFGVRAENQLVAMIGNRWQFDGYSELSGLCTHPEYRGRGLGESLLWHAINVHRREGLVSWLHVAAENTSAIKLYQRMGFKTVRTITAANILCID